MKNILIAFLTLLFTTINSQTIQKLNSKESKIEFIVKHDFQTSTRGKFNDFNGNLYRINKSGNETDSIAITINANSVTSSNSKKDLKSATYLNTKQYPKIQLNTIKTLKNEKGTTDYVAEVLVSMKGIQKKFEFKAVKEQTNPYDASGKIKLKAISNFDGTEFGFPVNDVLLKEGKPAGEEIIIDFHLVFDPVKKGK